MEDITNIIAGMLPSASKFHGSQFEEILDKTFAPVYNDLENTIKEIYNSYFINLANGSDLDRLGRLYNVFRGDDEDDEDYRSKIIFQAAPFCNRSNLEDLGCDIVENPNSEYSLEYTLLSRNIVEDPLIIIICPDENVKGTVERNYLCKNVSIIVEE